MKNAIFATSLIAVFATAPVQTALAEENAKFTLETGMNYNTGKYGGTQSTSILYVPVTGKYQGKSWTLKLTVPYLQISGPNNVINGVGLTGAASTTSTTRSGLGDVIVAATRKVYNTDSSRLMVYMTGKAKLGTANSAQGLGTGKNDYSFQSEVYQLTGSLTSFGTLGYKVYGKPPGYTLNDVFYGFLGGSYKFDQETNGGMMLSLAQKSTATGSSRMEAIIFASQKLDNSMKVQGYVLKGFTRSVPDWGIGATIVLLM
ncbi:MAG: hypothetical protein ACOY9D_03235 [Pseudomonadota bacterium]